MAGPWGHSTRAWVLVQGGAERRAWGQVPGPQRHPAAKPLHPVPRDAGGTPTKGMAPLPDLPGLSRAVPCPGTPACRSPGWDLQKVAELVAPFQFPAEKMKAFTFAFK